MYDDFDRESELEYNEALTEGFSDSLPVPGTKQDDITVDNNGDIIYDDKPQEETTINQKVNTNDDIKSTNKPKKGTIEINIDSVEEIISNFVFTTKQLENAVDKANNNINLQKILHTLEKIDTDKLESIKDINIDTKHINDTIQKASNTASKNIIEASKKIESKLKDYSNSVNNDTDILEATEKINSIESLVKKFKFKTIVYSSVAAAILSAAISFVALDKYYDLKIDEITRGNKAVQELLKQDIILSQNKKNKVLQLIFNEKIDVYSTQDGKYIIEMKTK